jgi:hypothetical protein
MMMSACYAKTDFGLSVVRERTLALPRMMRTMLVLTDGRRTGEQLTQLVQGSGEPELRSLVDTGLISEKLLASGAPSAKKRELELLAQVLDVEVDMELPCSSAIQEPSTSAPKAHQAAALGELYECLNAMAKEQLGLFKGLKYALEIEKASTAEQLVAIAHRYVVDVAKVKGEVAGRMARRALGLGD